MHGGDCSYNPSAFPPSLEVRRTNAAGARKRRSGLQSYCISSISAIAPCIALTSDIPVGRLVVRRRTTAGMQEVEQRTERVPR